MNPNYFNQGSANWFSVESDNNSFRLLGWTVSLATIRLSGYSMETARCEEVGFFYNLSLQKQAWGQIWPMGPILLTPGLSQSWSL